MGWPLRTVCADIACQMQNWVNLRRILFENDEDSAEQFPNDCSVTMARFGRTACQSESISLATM